MTMIIDGTNGLTFNDASTQTKGGLTSSSTQACQAWVNFSGLGSTTIRASYNVSSVTYNATGDYTVNFTTALTDASYSSVFGSGITGSGTANSQSTLCIKEGSTPTSSALRLTNNYGNGLLVNAGTLCVAVFR